MKVAIFYDSSNASKANIVKDIIKLHKCNAILYDETLQTSQDVNNLMSGITHVVFMSEDFSEKHPSFFMGYAIGAGLSIIMIEQDCKISKQWLNLFKIVSIDNFDSYFKLEKKQFSDVETKKKAKQKLLDKGYSLFTSNYVQAVLNNEVDIVKLFIKAGFSASELDELVTPVLYFAVRE